MVDEIAQERAVKITSAAWKNAQLMVNGAHGPTTTATGHAGVTRHAVVTARHHCVAAAIVKEPIGTNMAIAPVTSV